MQISVRKTYLKSTTTIKIKNNGKHTNILNKRLINVLKQVPRFSQMQGQELLVIIGALHLCSLFFHLAPHK